MQISSQEIIIFQKRKVKIHLSCEEIKIEFIEMEIVLLLALRVKHMETTTL